MSNATITKPGTRAAKAAANTTSRRSAAKPAAAKSTAAKPSSRRTSKAKTATPLAKADVPMTLTKMPAGKGGVRFDAATKDEALTTVYVAQDVWKKLGEPEAITVTVAPTK